MILSYLGVQETARTTPSGARVYADKGYNCMPDEAGILLESGVRLIPIRRKNMRPHDWIDEFDLALYRRRIETVYSQLDSMGIQHFMLVLKWAWKSSSMLPCWL